MTVGDLRSKYPSVRFYDPPCPGVYLQCQACEARAWISEKLREVIKSFPHRRMCSHTNKGMEGVREVEPFQGDRT